MIKLKCETDGGCGAEFEIDEKAVVKDEWLMCPICGKTTKNPLYEG